MLAVPRVQVGARVQGGIRIPGCAAHVHLHSSSSFFQMFKGPDQDIEFIYTAPSSAVCGVSLDIGGKKEYLIAGVYTDMGVGCSSRAPRGAEAGWLEVSQSLDDMHGIHSATQKSRGFPAFSHQRTDEFQPSSTFPLLE